MEDKRIPIESNKRKSAFYYILLLVGMTILFFLSWVILSSIYIHDEINYNVDYNTIIEKCSNESLMNSSECINQHIQKIYKFAITNDSINLTFDELKSKGGDCKDWSELYLNLTKTMGFNSEAFKIFIKNNNQNLSMYHEFVLAFNHEGYVIFDGEKLLENEFF